MWPAEDRSSQLYRAASPTDDNAISMPPSLEHALQSVHCATFIARLKQVLIEDDMRALNGTLSKLLILAPSEDAMSSNVWSLENSRQLCKTHFVFYTPGELSVPLPTNDRGILAWDGTLHTVMMDDEAREETIHTVGQHNVEQVHMFDGGVVIRIDGTLPSLVVDSEPLGVQCVGKSIVPNPKVTVLGATPVPLKIRAILIEYPSGAPVTTTNEVWETNVSDDTSQRFAQWQHRALNIRGGVPRGDYYFCFALCAEDNDSVLAVVESSVVFNLKTTYNDVVEYYKNLRRAYGETRHQNEAARLQAMMTWRERELRERELREREELRREREELREHELQNRALSNTRGHR